MPTKPRKWRFHLTGRALCLDYANTLSWRRGSAPIERLNEYEDVIAFALQAGVIGRSQARAIRLAALRRPGLALKAYRDALGLRAMTDRIFTKIVDGQAVDRADLAMLNDRFAEVTARMRVIPNGKVYNWRDIGDKLDSMFIPIVRSAASLLTSPDLEKLHRCAADKCGWLFVDQNRNQRRLWCDMRVCGNRAKARRHHDRAAKAIARRLA